MNDIAERAERAERAKGTLFEILYKVCPTGPTKADIAREHKRLNSARGNERRKAREKAVRDNKQRANWTI